MNIEQAAVLVLLAVAILEWSILQRLIDLLARKGKKG
jgi:hypothetical protein